MKNNLLKYYIVAFYLCSTFAMFAQPGNTSPDGLETDGDTTPAPIDDYVWVLGLVALVFVFLKFRSVLNKKINS
jgi:hypothetical protein